MPSLFLRPAPRGAGQGGAGDGVERRRGVRPELVDRQCHGPGAGVRGPAGGRRAGPAAGWISASASDCARLPRGSSAARSAIALALPLCSGDDGADDAGLPLGRLRAPEEHDLLRIMAESGPAGEVSSPSSRPWWSRRCGRNCCSAGTSRRSSRGARPVRQELPPDLTPAPARTGETLEYSAGPTQDGTAAAWIPGSRSCSRRCCSPASTTRVDVAADLPAVGVPGVRVRADGQPVGAGRDARGVQRGR